MLIDTHAHINFKAYQNDYDEVIKRALAQEIGIINVGADFQTSQKAVSLARVYDGVYAAVGLHPIHIQDEKFIFEQYEVLAQQEKVVAIGEIGLDYYHYQDQKGRRQQREIFERQIELAIKINKPMIFHCRDAHQDLIKILRNTNHALQGVIHCFSGDWAEAKIYFDLGLFIGFNGLITFSQQYDEMIKKASLEKILLETDCPFLTPLPFRGRRNEPSYVKYTAEKVAQIKNLSYKEIAEQTTKNAQSLFNLI